MTVKELLDLLKDKKESMEVVISYDGHLLNLSGKDDSIRAFGFFYPLKAEEDVTEK